MKHEQIGIGDSNITNIIVQGAITGASDSKVVNFTLYIDDIEVYQGHER